MSISKLCIALPLVLGAVSASPSPNEIAEAETFSPLNKLVTGHRAVPAIRRDLNSSFSFDNSGCDFSEKVCGNWCIDITYTCCPDQEGGCPLDERCQMGDNGKYGCCPIGEICVGDGGSVIEDDGDSDSDIDSGSGSSEDSSSSSSDSSSSDSGSGSSSDFSGSDSSISDSSNSDSSSSDSSSSDSGLNSGPSSSDSNNSTANSDSSSSSDSGSNSGPSVSGPNTGGAAGLRPELGVAGMLMLGTAGVVITGAL